MYSALIERAGSYLVHAHLSGNQVVDFPKLLQVLPGASAADRYSIMLTCRTACTAQRQHLPLSLLLPVQASSPLLSLVSCLQAP